MEHVETIVAENNSTISKPSTSKQAATTDKQALSHIRQLKKRIEIDDKKQLSQTTSPEIENVGSPLKKQKVEQKQKKY